MGLKSPALPKSIVNEKMRKINKKDKGELICACVALASLVGNKANWLSVTAGIVIVGYIGFKLWTVYYD